MSIPNLTYRYLHELTERLRKKKTESDLEELSNIAHQLLGSAIVAAFEIRTATSSLSGLVRESDKLSLWEKLTKLDSCAERLEAAAKAGGGYKSYPDGRPEDYQP